MSVCNNSGYQRETHQKTVVIVTCMSSCGIATYQEHPLSTLDEDDSWLNVKMSFQYFVC